MKSIIKISLTAVMLFGLSGNAMAFYNLDDLDKKPVVKAKVVKPVKVIKQVKPAAVHTPVKIVKKPVAAIVVTPKPVVKPVVKPVAKVKPVVKKKIVHRTFKKSVRKHHKRRYVSKASVRKIKKIRAELAKL